MYFNLSAYVTIWLALSIFLMKRQLFITFLFKLLCTTDSKFCKEILSRYNQHKQWNKNCL